MVVCLFNVSAQELDLVPKKHASSLSLSGFRMRKFQSGEKFLMCILILKNVSAYMILFDQQFLTTLQCQIPSFHQQLALQIHHIRSWYISYYHKGIPL